MKHTLCALAMLAAASFSSLHAQADLTTPAVFDVTQTVTNPNVEPFTFTMGDGPVNKWVSDSFEALTFRNKWYAGANADNEIVLTSSQASEFDTYAEGFYDGADIRVFRIINGVMTLVREDAVASNGHKASGWLKVEGQKDANGADGLIGGTSYTVRLPGWYRPGVAYWFTVRAVDDQGNESADAAAVSILVNTVGQTDPTNNVVAFTGPATPSETNPPAAPTNLQASLDAEGRVVLSWTGVSDSDLAGYRVYRSDLNPANHRGYSLELAGTAANEQEKIKAGDMVFLLKQHFNWDRDTLITNRMWGTSQVGSPGVLHQFSNEVAGQEWSLAQHPGTVPAELAAQGGQRCLQVDLTNTSQFRIWSWNTASGDQSYYRQLTPGVTYVVEVWLRHENMTTPQVTFDLNGGPWSEAEVPSTTWNVTNAWQKYTTTFTVPYIWETGSGVAAMELEMNGPGTVWIDNYRVYEQGTDFLDFSATEYAVLSNSGMKYARTHSTIKSASGYTMESLTNYRGAVDYKGRSGNSPHTMDSLLSFMETAGINPWLQVEFYHDEAEWLGFVEFLAAPYDPGIDTPATKPWAYKRYQQGRTAPWTDAFSSIYLELSNETWNPLFDPWTFNFQSMTDSVTGANYQSGALYGLFQEYIFSIIRSSPYWTPALEDKFTCIVGGWAIQTDVNGYGAQAALNSPSSEFVTIANYNGGWEAGEDNTTVADPNFFGVMNIVNRRLAAKALESMETVDAIKSAGGPDVQFGVYEGGPGYILPNSDIDKADPMNREYESQVMKSQAGGVATLDTFLYSAMVGFDVQNFFTWSRNRHFWTSHAPLTSGGQAYPAWQVLEVFNKQGTGDFLRVNALSAPTYDFAAEGGVKPVVNTYVTRDGNRYNVFVLSNKLDDYPVVGDSGYTPVTVNLPFSAPTSITLHKMDSGDPRNNNLDAENVSFTTQSIPTSAFSQSFVLDENTGATVNGIPPGTVYLYVFEGVTTESLPAQPEVTISRAFDQPATVASSEDVRFIVSFDRAMTGFDNPDLDVLLLGSAEPASATIEELSDGFSVSYLVTVSGMQGSGDVYIDVPGGAAQAASGGQGNSSASGLSAAVTLNVTPVIPDAPGNLRFSEDGNTLTVYWDGDTDLAQQADSYTLRWGTSPGSLSNVVTGITTPSYVFNNYTPGTTYYFAVEAINVAGTSAASTTANAYSFFDDFNGYATGVAPTGWTVDAINATVETQPAGLPSPTGTQFLKNSSWNRGTVTYDAGSSLEYLTVSSTFARGGTNGFDSNGVVAQFTSATSHLKVEIGKNAVTFYSRDGSQYDWKQNRSLVPDDGETDYVQDYGEFWTVQLQVVPGSSAGTVKALITVTDASGNDMIQNSGSGTKAGNVWILDNVPAPLNGTVGTFGLLSNVAAGGSQIANGVYFDSVSVSPAGLLNEAPRVTEDLSAPSTVSGLTATLGLTAEDANDEDLTYTFETLIQPDGSSVAFTGGASVVAASRASVSKDVSVDVPGIYKFRVSVSDGTNTITSRTRTVSFELSGPQISGQPANQTVKEGADAAFTVSATGDGLQYQWESTSVGGSAWSAITGATASTLSITGVTPADELDYRVVITDSYSQSVTSDSATLTVDLVPTITTTSLPDATEGDAYSQQLTASSGTGSLTWSIISGALPAGLSLGTDGQISGTPTASGSSNITVEAIDTNGDSDNQALNITVNPAAPSGDPVMLAQWEFTDVSPKVSPLAADALNGALASAAVVEAGLGWNGNPYYSSDAVGTTGGNSASLTEAVTNNDYIAWTLQVAPGQTVSLTDLLVGVFFQFTNQTFSYEIRVSADPANFDTTFVTLAEFPDGGSPVSGTGLGDSSALPVTANLSGVSTLQNLSSGANVEFRIYIWGAGNQYQGLGIGKLGTSVVDLQIDGIVGGSGPSIASQPSSMTVKEGSSASLSVVASGNALQYQWESTSVGGSSWSTISGATSDTLSFSSILSADEQDYRVVVTDAQSQSVTSDTATLWVDLVPRITTTSLSVATEEQSYGAAMSAASGTGTLTWSASGLPSGLSLGTDGSFSGSPAAGSAAGSPYTVDITVSDASIPADTDTESFSLTVDAGSSNNDNPSTYNNGGMAWTITSGITRIEAEDFDEGGSGIAYFDTSAGNNGTGYRTTDVDIQSTSDTGGGFNVGWIVNGEWLEYTVDVETGTYDIVLRVASANSNPGDALLLLGDGINFTELGTYTVEGTGGWQNWTSLTLSNVSLSGADDVLRIEMVGGSFNINWIEFIQVGSGN